MVLVVTAVVARAFGHWKAVRVLLWHVHGSWTTSFVQGEHEVVVPVNEARDADGRGRARTYNWPDRVREVPIDRLRNADLDVVVLQRPHEHELCTRWLGLRPGGDIPAIYVEHNTPGGAAVTTRHPLAWRSDIPIVHVTPTNRLLWDSGSAPTLVIEHGIVDPGHRFTGEVPRAAVVLNEPLRRGRAVGTDLISQMCRSVPVDVFGMAADQLAATHGGLGDDQLRTYADLTQDELHAEMARRRVYVHLHRWTSLGLAMLEAMHLGLPIVALGATEVPFAVPPEAGVVSPEITHLRAGARHFVRDASAGATVGRAARDHALAHFGLGRFLSEWDALLRDVVTAWHVTPARHLAGSRSHW